MIVPEAWWWVRQRFVGTGCGRLCFRKTVRVPQQLYGKSGIVNIERGRYEWGFPYQGVMILSRYIGHKYAQDIPFVNASLCLNSFMECGW